MAALITLYLTVLSVMMVCCNEIIPVELFHITIMGLNLAGNQWSKKVIILKKMSSMPTLNGWLKTKTKINETKLLISFIALAT